MDFLWLVEVEIGKVLGVFEDRRTVGYSVEQGNLEIRVGPL